MLSVRSEDSVSFRCSGHSVFLYFVLIFLTLIFIIPLIFLLFLLFSLLFFEIQLIHSNFLFQLSFLPLPWLFCTLFCFCCRSKCWLCTSCSWETDFLKSSFTYINVCWIVNVGVYVGVCVWVCLLQCDWLHGCEREFCVLHFFYQY